MKTPCITPECPYGVGPLSTAGLCNKCVKARNAKRRYVKKTLLKISEKDIETLQRYNLNYDGYDESDSGNWIKLDDLIKLLK